ncbi:MGMT family protein [bacterium]|nr:MGMT family protein [bacterium]
MSTSLAKYDAILATVQSIPPGRVATYGQVAAESGWPGRARLVGRALGLLPPDSAVPWHRVVNAAGRISLRGDGASVAEQAQLLASEGVVVSAAGRIDLRRFGWQP